MKHILCLLLICALLLSACPAYCGQPAETTVLIYSSFAGGGPEYSVAIADESVLSCTVRYDFGGQENQILDGAHYEVIFTFTALRAGETAVTVRWESPILDCGESYFTAIVDENLNITLNKEPSMKVRVYEKAFTAALEDNETARAFAALLPMDFDMAELNGNEKYYYLDASLPSSPEPVGHIEAGDIMLYGNDCVVLFYKSLDTPYSYTRIGKIRNTEGLAEQLGDDEAWVCFERED